MKGLCSLFLIIAGCHVIGKDCGGIRCLNNHQDNREDNQDLDLVVTVRWDCRNVFGILMTVE
jgi:hypothetical protein